MTVSSKIVQPTLRELFVGLIGIMVGSMVTIVTSRINAQATRDAAQIPAEVALKAKCFDEVKELSSLAKGSAVPEQNFFQIRMTYAQLVAMHCELAPTVQESFLAYISDPNKQSNDKRIPTARPIAQAYFANQDKFVKVGEIRPDKNDSGFGNAISSDDWAADWGDPISSDHWGVPAKAEVGDSGWTMAATATSKGFDPIFRTKLHLVGGFVPAPDDPKNIMRPMYRTLIRTNTEFPDGTGKNPALSFLDTEHCVRVTEFVPRDDVLWARVLVIDCPTK